MHLTPGAVVRVGDRVTLFCAIECDEIETKALTTGIVEFVYAPGDVFLVRFPGGRLEVVTRIELTPH